MILDKVIIELVPDDSGCLTITACLVYGKWSDTSLQIIPDYRLTNPDVINGINEIKYEIRKAIDYKIGIPDVFYGVDNHDDS
jgi:hypothetical protein